MNTSTIIPMRENIKLLLVYITIGVTVAGITTYFLYQDRKEQWNEYARKAFTEALKAEIEKRNEMKVYFVTQGETSLSSPEKEFPKEVRLKSKHGEIIYPIPLNKRFHNITNDINQRILQGYVLEKSPLKADSLQLVWENHLKKVEYPGKGIIRLSIIDLQKQEKQTFSCDSALIMKSDSLISFYIGFRYENGVTGLVSYSWWKTLGLKDKLLLGSIVVFCILLYFIVEKSSWLYRRFFVKEMPVIAVEKSKAHIYQLDDVLFDVEQNLLKSGDVIVKMNSQAVILLHGFLKAENYKLSVNEIFKLLWPDGSGTSERMHTAIGRLRKYLAEVSNWTIDKGYLYYQLKMPHSIEEKPIIDL